MASDVAQTRGLLLPSQRSPKAKMSDAPQLTFRVLGCAAAQVKLHDAGIQTEGRGEIICSRLLNAVQPWRTMEGYTPLPLGLDTASTAQSSRVATQRCVF